MGWRSAPSVLAQVRKGVPSAASTTSVPGDSARLKKP
jgi:hypothetical protein